MLFSMLLFFFFKQKTAYEMRISDWSSDVCSSDLQPARAAPDLLQRPSQRHAPAHRPARGRRLEPREQRDPDAEGIEDLHRRHPGAVAGGAARQGAAPQARARPGPDRHRLPAADGGARQQREPRHRNLGDLALRSEEHTSELQSLMRISYAVFCLQKQNKQYS